MGFFGSDSKSSTDVTNDSRTSTVTRTLQNTRVEDQRVGSSGEAIALGANSRYTITDQFPEPVARALENSLKQSYDFADKNLTLTKDLVKAFAASGKDSLAEVAERVDRQEKGDKTVFTDIFPIVALVAVGLGAAYVLRNALK